MKETYMYFINITVILIQKVRNTVENFLGCKNRITAPCRYSWMTQMKHKIKKLKQTIV